MDLGGRQWLLRFVGQESLGGRVGDERRQYQRKPLSLGRRSSRGVEVGAFITSLKFNLITTPQNLPPFPQCKDSLWIRPLVATLNEVSASETLNGDDVVLIGSPSRWVPWRAP